MRFGFFCQKVCVSITWRDFRRPDADRDRAERAVRRGVAVAAHDHQARNGQPLLRPDHVHDALARVVQAHQHDAVLVGVLDDLVDHALASDGSANGRLRACVGT